MRKILKKPKGSNPDVLDVIDMVEMRKRLGGLEHAYRTVISNIRRLDSSDRPKNLPSFQKLPIIIHGYDYPFPHPWPERIGGFMQSRLG